MSRFSEHELNEAAAREHVPEQLAKVDRTVYAPIVVEALKGAAARATALAAELEQQPGVGIGLSYATVFAGFAEAERVMRYYQNELRGGQAAGKTS